MKKHLILSLVLLTIVQVGFAQTAPSISSLSSKSGTIGELITIDGSNFNASVGSNIVYFGNIKAVITSESSSQLTVQIPPTTSLSNVRVLSNGLSSNSEKFLLENSSSGNLDLTWSDEFFSIPNKTDFNSEAKTSARFEVADFDNDGDMDFAFGLESKIEILVNPGYNSSFFSSSFSSILIDTSVSGSIADLKAADLDNDGDIDIVVTFGYYGTNNQSFEVFENNNGSFTSAGNYTFSNRYGADTISLFDMNNDGYIDITGSGYKTYSFNPAAQTFIQDSSNLLSFNNYGSTPNTYSSSFTKRSITDDFNNDGEGDVVSLQYNNGLVISYGSGNGVYPAQIDLGADTEMYGYSDIDVLDFNNDGYNDLSVPGQSTHKLFVNNGDGTFDYTSITKHERFGQFFDINNDGELDIVGSDTFYISAAKGLGNLDFDSKTNFIYRNDFTNSKGYIGESTLLDLNGDGYLDLTFINNNFSFTSSSFYVSEFVGNTSPSINVNESSLLPFSSCSGSASSEKTFLVSGNYLTNNILISSLNGFEYSTDNNTFSSSLILEHSSGSVPSTTVYVRMKDSNTESVSGNIVISSVGATSKSVTVSGVIISNELFSNYLNLDGTNDFVNIPDDNSLDLSNALTVEAWIFPTLSGEDASQVIIGKIDDTTLGRASELAYAIRLNRFGLVAEVGDGSTSKRVTSGTINVKLNQWQHVAMVFDGSTGDLKLYIDGSQVGGTLATGFTSLLNSSSSLKFGSYGTHFDQYFKGGLDQVRIWNTVRTRSEIQDSMNSELTGANADLVVQYNFNQGVAGGNNSSISTIDGLLGNGNSGLNGTLTNFALTDSTSNFASNSLNQITGSLEVCLDSTESYSFPILGGLWSSSDTDVFTVNSSGVLSPVSSGTAQVEYTYSLYGCSFTEVKNITVSSVELPTLSGDQTLIIDETAQYGASSSSGALVFDGINDFVKTSSNITALNINGDITVEAWINIRQLPADWVRIVGKGDNSNRTYGLWLATDGRLLWQTYGTTINMYSASALEVGQWYHIAAVRNGSTAKIYINGVESNSTTFTGTPRSSTQPLTIGFDNIPLHDYFIGSIDEVRVWNSARSSTQILANKDQNLDPQSGLVAYYKFEDASGNSLSDSSGNQYDGTLTNFDLSGTSSNWGSREIVTTSGLWSSSDTSIATVTSSGVVTAISAGTTTINFTVNGVGGCSSVTSTSTRTVTVLKKNASISGLNDINLTITDSPIILSGSTSSTSQIIYSSSNTSVATISGTTLVPTGVGNATITAAVAENTSYLSASATFAVSVILGDTDGDGIIDANDNCPSTANADQLDTDNDGIGDVCDSDIDGDGIPNTSDADQDGDGTIDNGTDTDSDGINDANDPDIDGDGIPNASDVDPDGNGTNDNGIDTDGDGTNDANDLDIDGDGIPNASDVDPDGDGINDNGTDTDGDGTNDANDPDIDGDGVPNGRDSNPTNPDQDGDGILDGADVDIDGDGINDNGTDTDGDGINNANDTDDDGDGVLDVNDAFPLDPNESLDTDVDGVGNNADTDDDNDGVLDVNDDLPLDSTESVDADGDGIGNNADTDDDGDGVLDVDDAFPLDATETVDTDGDGTGDNSDTDDDNDGVLDVNDAFPLDSTESADTDSDGIGNNTDTDDDGDGVLDVNDAFPLDATETIDTDGDGTGDNSDPDIDGDGIPNASDVDSDGDGTNDNGSDFDGDGYNDAGDTDDDNDGVLDVNDAFPLDATETVDTDGDGTGNNADTDDDGDGLSDTEEAELNTNPLLVDTDNDGVIDATEVTDKTNPLNPCSLIVEHQTESAGMTYWDSLDCDDDGVPNGQEVSSTPANSGSRTTSLYAFDTDGDGILNYMDADDDGDGVNTIDELLLNSSTGEYSVIDSDQDATPNYLDSDDDNDGIDTIVETLVDTDGDGTPDYLDSDDDGDGVITALELSFSNTQNPTEFDSDGDGIPNHLDAEDNYEPTIATISVDPNTFVYLDTDGDGIPNMTDSDDDNDGFTDAVEVSCNANPLRIESQPGDYDDDGIADCIDADIDGDGVDNESDVFPLNPFESADNDNDGIGDNVDADDDNDGVIDALDAFPLDPNESADTDGDGIGNNVDNDLYNDGFDDSRLEVSGVLTPNTNGVESTWKITNINLHPLNKVAVYDTNGVEVFSTENYDNSWDGTYKGTTRRVPAGSYLYKVYLYDTRETLTGWLYIAY